MTREEAIDYLQVMKDDYPLYDMAIQALSQEPCRVKNELNVELNELKLCTDAVSREAVLNAICDYVAFEEYEDKSHTFTIRPLTKRIKQLPPVTQKSGKWIPVSERLPEDNYAVLIWCPERKNTYCAYREENQWWIFGAYFQKVPLEVIAWMPLPKPYEPQESEEQTE